MKSPVAHGRTGSLQKRAPSYPGRGGVRKTHLQGRCEQASMRMNQVRSNSWCLC
jgi:hypothetical protein